MNALKFISFSFVTTLCFQFSGNSQSCDTLRNYNPNNLSIITGGGGYLLGNSQLGGNNILSWAEPYTIAGPIELRSLRFLPVRISDGGGSVTFNVYNDAAGVPGAVIYSETRALSTLTELAWNTIQITTPPSLNGNYWVGYDLSYVNAADTFALAGNYNYNNSANFTYFYETGGPWVSVPTSFVDDLNDPLGTAFTIDLLLSNAPSPVAAFTGNDEACLGGGVFNVDGSSSTNSDLYNWYLEDVPFTVEYDNATGQTATLTPTTASVGNNQAIFLVTRGGCRADAVGYFVDVYPAVSATVNTTNTTCGNNNGQISITNQAGGSGTYQYSLDGVSYQGINSFTGLAPGPYTVYVRTAGNACETTYSVTVGATPPETITMGASPEICVGQTVNITATGTGTIEWFEGATSLGTGPSISVSPSNTTSYSATLTDANGCTDSDQLTVTVNSLPSVTANTTNSSICLNESATISATGATSYNWDNGLGAGVSHSVSPTTNTTYQVTGTDGNGCVNTATVFVEVNSLPTVTASATSTSICLNESTTLSATGATSYNWDNGLGVGVSHSVSPTANTTYQVTGTDGNGCENTANVNIVVNALPIISATATSNLICANTNITLNASGATTYSWDNGLGTGASHIVAPSSNTTYQVTGTDGNGCQNTATVSIVVNALPIVVATTSNAEICVGSNSSVSASGATTYSWDNGLGAGASHSVSPTTTTTYQVTGTDGNGCQNTAIIQVIVNPIDDASFTFNNYCEGSSNGATNIALTGGTFVFNPNPGDGTTINNTSGEITNGILGTTYFIEYITNGPCPSSSIESATVQSSDDPSFLYDDVCIGGINAPYNIATTGGTFTFNPVPGDGASIDANSGIISGAILGNTYTIEYTTPAGICQASSAQTVSVFNSPTVIASADETICEGDVITISATGANTYEWDNSLVSGASHTVSPISNITYQVIGTDANGCTNTDEVTISVNPAPAVVASNDVEACQGEHVNITATGADTYFWDNGIGAGQSHSVAPGATTTYSVTGTDAMGCAAIDQVTITIYNPIVVTETITPSSNGMDGVIQLNVSGGDGSFTFSWDNGATTQDISGLGGGTYTVTITDGNGCVIIQTFIVEGETVGLHQHLANINIELYPNPANNQVTLKVDNESFNYIIMNSIGKLITIGEADFQTTIYTNNFESGVYFVTIQVENQEKTLRFVINH